jgi:type II secretory pathway predicted ATPase ExeA
VISPLTAEDTADYLRFRLKLVGCERDLFADDAKALLHEHAQGTLRDLDRLATAGLREAAKRKRKAVAAEDIERAALLTPGAP